MARGGVMTETTTVMVVSVGCHCRGACATCRRSGAICKDDSTICKGVGLLQDDVSELEVGTEHAETPTQIAFPKPICSPSVTARC